MRRILICAIALLASGGSVLAQALPSVPAVLPPLSAVLAIDPAATTTSAPLDIVGRDGQRTVLGVLDPSHHTFVPAGLPAEIARAVAAEGKAVQTGSVGGLAGVSMNSGNLPPLDTSLAGTSNPDAIMALPGGRVSFFPALSGVTSPSSDHQRASLLISGTTHDDGHSEEQLLALTMTINSGYARPWAASTQYAVGDNVKFQDGRNSVYRAVQAGTSAASGSGPSGTGSSIADGSVVWAWINDATIDAKLPLYVEANVLPGAGETWSAAFNSQLQPGVVPSFNIGIESDFTNNSGMDCNIGAANCNNLEVTTSGPNQSTTGVHISSANGGPTYGTHWGLRLNGNFLASDADMEDDAGGPIGLGFNVSGFGSGSHSVAVIQNATNSPSFLVNTGVMSNATFNDVGSAPATVATSGPRTIADLVLGASGPRAIQINGSRTSAGYEDNATEPAAFHPQGNYALATYIDTSHAYNGIDLSGGTYTNAQFNGKNFTVSPDGSVAANHVKGLNLASSGGALAVCAAPDGTLYTHAVGGC